MTPCHDFADRVDRMVADGLAPGAADATHLESCAECRGLLRRARALDAALIARPAPEPPQTFTTQVMTAVRRERWRAEQFLDLGFNFAVATGLLLIVAGVLGLAWRTGLIVIGGDLAALMSAGISIVVDRAALHAPNVGIAALLLTMALGLWWWAEGVEV
jgi:hypothetical protein